VQFGDDVSPVRSKFCVINVTGLSIDFVVAISVDDKHSTSLPSRLQREQGRRSSHLCLIRLHAGQAVAALLLFDFRKVLWDV
jgi:hypothetical protein